MKEVDLRTRVVEDPRSGFSKSDSRRFHALLRDYFESVSEKRPDLTSLEPPRGVRDVRRQLDSLRRGKTPSYPDSYFTGTSDDSLVGFVSFRDTKHCWVETHWVVGEHFRGRGYGRALMRNFVYEAAGESKFVQVHNPTPRAKTVLQSLQETYDIRIREEQ